MSKLCSPVFGDKVSFGPPQMFVLGQPDKTLSFSSSVTQQASSSLASEASPPLAPEVSPLPSSPPLAPEVSPLPSLPSLATKVSSLSPLAPEVPPLSTCNKSDVCQSLDLGKEVEEGSCLVGKVETNPINISFSQLKEGYFEFNGQRILLSPGQVRLIEEQNQEDPFSIKKLTLS